MRQSVRSPGGNQQKVVIGKWLMLRRKKVQKFTSSGVIGVRMPAFGIR
jgi:hypothetical protein